MQHRKRYPVGMLEGTAHALQLTANNLVQEHETYSVEHVYAQKPLPALSIRGTALCHFSSYKLLYSFMPG